MSVSVCVGSRKKMMNFPYAPFNLAAVSLLSIYQRAHISRERKVKTNLKEVESVKHA